MEQLVVQCQTANLAIVLGEGYRQQCSLQHCNVQCSCYESLVVVNIYRHENTALNERVSSGMARHVTERASQNSNFFEVVVGVDLRCRAHNCCEFCWCRHKFFNRDLNFVFLHCPYARSRALSPSNFQIKFRWAGWDLARSRVFSQVSSQ